MSSANESLNEQVHGLANGVCEIALLERPLPDDEQDHKSAAGAVVEFRGVVRPTENSSMIRGIDYEAHAKMAEHQLRMIAQQAIVLFGLFAVKIQHRVGFVAAGEASLYLRVAAAHRAEAFDASKWIVDELKKRTPIWKSPQMSAAVRELSAK